MENTSRTRFFSNSAIFQHHPQASVMKTALVAFVLFVATAVHSCAQGSFQNLFFENATIVPDGSSPHLINADAALPGWSVSYGSGPGGVNIIYNDFNLSYAAVGLHDPSSTITHPLQGNYSVMLQSSQYPFPADSASISQTGLVPLGTKSLVFMGQVLRAIFKSPWEVRHSV